MCNKPNTKRQILYDSAYMRSLEESIHRDRQWKGGSHGLEWGWGEELLFNGDRISVWDDEKVLDCSDG